MILNRLAPLLLAPMLACGLPPAFAADAKAPAGEPCYLPRHGQALRCLKLPVPLDARAPEGPKITLHVTIAPALRESAKGDPLFVLAGGPGEAGSDIVGLLDSTFRVVRTARDIVLIDQRGTGLSGKLDCDSTRGLEGKSDEEQERILGACLASLKADFSKYTTEAAADDIDAVRERLGYAKLNLWGGSYGTRLAQAYARKYPQRTRALILDGVASDEQIVFAWGRDVQAALDATFARCDADAACKKAYPALRAQFAALKKQAMARQVKLDFRHPRTAAPTHLDLPPDAFLQTMRGALYAPDAARRLPFIIDSAAKGNWAPFLAVMYAPDDLRLGGSAAGLLLAVTCAEDIPRLTPAIIAEEERASFLEGAEVKRFPQLCKLVKVPPVVAPPAKNIEAPVLLMSGALDPVTPPRRAEEAMRHMTLAQHVVAPQLGHVISGHGCAPRLLRAFLERPEQPVDAACLREIPAPGFQLGPAGPQP